MDYKKTTLILIGLIGLILFAGLFSFTYSVPEVVEESAKGFVKAQIEKEVRQKYQTMVESDLGSKAFRLAAKYGLKESQLSSGLENKLPEKIAEIVAQMCGYDCEKKKNLAKSITKSTLNKIKSLQVAQFNLADVVKGQFLKIVENLKLDLRIFLGCNALLFALVLIVSLLKPQAVQHLFLPSILLIIATAISSSIYVLGQDWFYTIIYNDYMGFAYMAYVAVIFAFLMDIIFNSARLTAEIINSIAGAIGSAVSVAPC